MAVDLDADAPVEHAVHPDIEWVGDEYRYRLVRELVAIFRCPDCGIEERVLVPAARSDQDGQVSDAVGHLFELAGVELS